MRAAVVCDLKDLGGDGLFVYTLVILAITFTGGVLFILKKVELREFLILFGFSVLGILSLSAISPTDVVIKRQDYGGDEYDKEIYLENGDLVEKGSVRVEPLNYSEEELKNLSEEVFDYLSKEILGDNEDMGHIRTGIILPSDLEGYPFDIYWTSSDTDIISTDGTVHNEDLSGENNCVVTASLDMGENSYTRQFALTVLPKSYSETEEKKRRVISEIERRLKESPEEKTVTIPESIDGFKIYEEPAVYATALIWPIIAIVFLIYKRLHKKEEMIREEKKRHRLLEEVYPDFVGQLMLYMSSGVTVRMAFDSLKGYYSGKTKEAAVLIGKELSVTVNEMKRGISEQQAYNNFGKRCGGNRYRKLMALLNQSITVGSKGILLRLDELLDEAFENRKEMAKKRGEEASTKLLIPMILMLATVMALLMVPGFMGMGL